MILTDLPTLQLPRSSDERGRRRCEVDGFSGWGFGVWFGVQQKSSPFPAHHARQQVAARSTLFGASVTEKSLHEVLCGMSRKTFFSIHSYVVIPEKCQRQMCPREDAKERENPFSPPAPHGGNSPSRRTQKSCDHRQIILPLSGMPRILLLKKEFARKRRRYNAITTSADAGFHHENPRGH